MRTADGHEHERWDDNAPRSHIHRPQGRCAPWSQGLALPRTAMAACGHEPVAYSLPRYVSLNFAFAARSDEVDTVKA